mmetsp:Transcript_19457/g.44280  ORF Transcript_19457/g.44280 Transcript_19457/m.44280 type:complete len:209 (+) Transcript_19457:295-921(+)
MSHKVSASPGGPPTSRNSIGLESSTRGCAAKQPAPESHQRATCACKSKDTRGGRRSEFRLSPCSSKSLNGSKTLCAARPLEPLLGRRTAQRPSLLPPEHHAAHRRFGGHWTKVAKGGKSGKSILLKVSPMSWLIQMSRCTSDETPPPTTNESGLPGTVQQAGSRRAPNGAFSHIRCHVRQSVSDAHTSAFKPDMAWPPTTYTIPLGLG